MVTASFLGLTLDAFDFFILVFVVNAIAGDFHTEIADIPMRHHLDLGDAARGRAFGSERRGVAFGRSPANDHTVHHDAAA